jgi:hypothetical protein
MVKIAIAGLCLIFTQLSYAQKIPLKIYFPTEISGGKLSPRELIKMSKTHNINHIILVDHYIRRYEYGTKPLRNIIKRSIEKDSITRMGIDKYIDLYNEINREFKNIEIIPSLYISPFYYWDKGKLKGNERGLFIFGLKDIKSLPNLGNNPPKCYNIKGIIGLWPFAIFIWVISLYPKKRILAILLFIIGFITLINNFPFSSNIYDQYHGDQKIIPYRYLIDYVNKKGGYTFWDTDKLDNFCLINTYGYTGISVDKESSSIDLNGIWDKLLIDYMDGKRNKPVYIIGINTWDDIILSDSNKILQSFKNGNLYIERSLDILNNFSITDSVTGHIADIGGTYNFKGSPRIRIELNIPDRDVIIRIIRNGEVIKSINIKKGKGSMGFSYIDEHFKKDKRVYYRLIFYHKDNIILATNPIFIKFL